MMSRCRLSAGVCRDLNHDRGRSGQVKNGDEMRLKRMDNVGIVVESLDAAISFFNELGLELE